jgi:hypothetical protein
VGRFLCWDLVFVILTFFKEGIGNNLTMPSGSWVLEMGLGSWFLNLGSWKWVLGLGSGTFDTSRVPFDLFWFSFGQMGNGSGTFDTGRVPFDLFWFSFGQGQGS